MTLSSNQPIIAPMVLLCVQHVVFDIPGKHLPAGGTDIHRQTACLHPFTPTRFLCCHRVCTSNRLKLPRNAPFQFVPGFFLVYPEPSTLRSPDESSEM